MPILSGPGFAVSGMADFLGGRTAWLDGLALPLSVTGLARDTSPRKRGERLKGRLSGGR